MKVSTTQIKVLCNIAAGSCFTLFLYRSYFLNNTSAEILAISAAFALLSYRTSLRHKINNTLKNLIERRENDLVIARLKTSPFSKKSSLKKIAIARISSATIGDNYLSISIDGNGNDFQLLGQKNEIHKHLLSLLTHEESESINITCVT